MACDVLRMRSQVDVPVRDRSNDLANLFDGSSYQEDDQIPVGNGIGIHVILPIYLFGKTKKKKKPSHYFRLK